jgi:hypothetical protein
MFFVTEDATIICKHPVGLVDRVPSQNWFTIATRRVLVDADPENRTIKGCANSGVGIKPCTTALKVIADVGYSTFIRVGGQRVCLDAITGFTDGTPPGLYKWVVSAPGQQFVEGVI